MVKSYAGSADILRWEYRYLTVVANMSKEQRTAVRAQKVRWQDLTLVERSVIEAALRLRGWNDALIVEFWKDVAREMSKVA